MFLDILALFFRYQDIDHQDKNPGQKTPGPDIYPLWVKYEVPGTLFKKHFIAFCPVLYYS